MTSPTRPSSTAWYALRRTLPTWSFDENLRELIKTLPRYRVDELVVKIDTEEFSHGQVPLEWAQRYQPGLFAIRDALAKIGVAYSLNPWITVGHCDRGRDARPQLPGLRCMVGHDGVTLTACACPLSEAWRAHTAELWTLYAGTRPRVFWVEDDIRTFNHLPVRYGCFCEEHLRLFSERLGRSVTRSELVMALLQPDEPHPWRRAYLDLQAKIIEDTAAFLARVVHRVSPETQLGLMSSGPRQHCVEGRRWNRLAHVLADGQALFSRAPLANYWEESLRGLYYSQDSIKITRYCLPEGVIEQTEVENIPFTRYSKSARFTFLQMAVSFAYGSHGVTLNLFDHAGTPMENDPAFGRMLAQRKPFLEALAVHSTAPGAYRGVQLLFREDATCHKRLRAGADYGELAADGDAAMGLLEAHGIPTTYGSESIAAATGQQFHSYHNEEIDELLRNQRGLLLDGMAAFTLYDRGFGDLIGIRAMTAPEPIDQLSCAPLSAEELHDAEFGGADKRYLTLTLPSLMSRPRFAMMEASPGARIVSHAVDPEGRRRHPCAIVFENRLGGRVYVHALDWASAYGIAFHHPFRLGQLHAAVRWLGHGAVPLLVRGDGVYPLAFRKDSGRETLVGLFNLSLDPWKKTEFHLADRRTPQAIWWLSPQGHWSAASGVSVKRLDPVLLSLRHDGRIPFESPLFLRLEWAEESAVLKN